MKIPKYIESILINHSNPTYRIGFIEDDLKKARETALNAIEHYKITKINLAIIKNEIDIVNTFLEDIKKL